MAIPVKLLNRKTLDDVYRILWQTTMPVPVPCCCQRAVEFGLVHPEYPTPISSHEDFSQGDLLHRWVIQDVWDFMHPKMTNFQTETFMGCWRKKTMLSSEERDMEVAHGTMTVHVGDVQRRNTALATHKQVAYVYQSDGLHKNLPMSFRLRLDLLWHIREHLPEPPLFGKTP